ncbi:ATP-binding protein [Denitrificimonas caeni]|uniref:ATP-binding protein n=1 Tax=Denitrificimonas caeni TaxID=521720 RepID=UPI003B28D61F
MLTQELLVDIHVRHQRFFECVLNIELDGRMQRSQDMLLKTSGMPAIKHFEDYDFKFASGVPRKRYAQGSIIVTSNLQFSQWSTAFADEQTLSMRR